MQEINLEIIEKEDQIKVTSPYNQKFVNKARNLRGKWKDGAWWFDDSIVDYVRDLMKGCFGTTGEEPYDNVDLVISNFTDSYSRGAVELFGRTIAKAWGRDSGAKLGDGIILISGRIKSGGSVKNWYTEVDGADFIIKDFPKPATELSEVKKAIDEGWCEVKEQKKKVDCDQESIYEKVKYCIENTSDIVTLRNMLIETLENTKGEYYKKLHNDYQEIINQSK